MTTVFQHWVDTRDSKHETNIKRLLGEGLLRERETRLGRAEKQPKQWHGTESVGEKA